MGKGMYFLHHHLYFMLKKIIVYCYYVVFLSHNTSHLFYMPSEPKNSLTTHKTFHVHTLLMTTPWSACSTSHVYLIPLCCCECHIHTTCNVLHVILSHITFDPAMLLSTHSECHICTTGNMLHVMLYILGAMPFNMACLVMHNI